MSVGSLYKYLEGEKPGGKKLVDLDNAVSEFST